MSRKKAIQPTPEPVNESAQGEHPVVRPMRPQRHEEAR